MCSPALTNGIHLPAGQLLQLQRHALRPHPHPAPKLLRLLRPLPSLHRALNVSGLNISGFIPSSIEGLSHLTLLNVSHNYLYSSSLNATTCNSSAQLLSLHNNCFNSSAMPCNLTHTQRPREKCSAFCHLSPPSTPPCPGHGYCYWKGGEGLGKATDMNDNRMTGQLLPNLKALKKLTYMDLSNNRFSGSLPSRLTSLKALRTLKLDNNKLSGALAPLPKNVRFSARYNYLSRANSVTCKKGYLENNCFLDKKRHAIGGGGLAFVVSSTKKRGNGSGVGYAGMDKRSMAVEFDTWLDKQDKDTSANHVGVNLKGSPFSVKTANVSKDLNNGRMYFAWVDYGPGESESLRVFVNASNTKPDNPSLSMNLSLCDLLQPTPKKNSYYFGFVAASLPRHEQEHLVATTTIDIATGLVLDVDTFNPTIASPFTRYVSVGYSPAQDGQDSWNIPTLSTWTFDSTWEAPDQGDCSDCWAYAVVASIEAAYGIATNNKTYPSLSIDSLFEITRMASCESGSPTLAFQKLVASKKGLRNTSSWDSSPSSLASVRSPSSSLVAWLFKAVWHSPSLGKAALPRRHRAAAAAAETGNYIVSGFERTAFKGYFGLMLAVRRQPVVVHIEASAASFVNYNGSFRYDEPDCYTGNLNHVVLVTGYLLMGTDKNRPRTLSPFWRIRNSWGTEWGAEGYIHMGIAPGEGICGINVLPGIYPIIRSTPASAHQRTC
ncbi:hypothetical protein CLOM_g23095 [Closterium sp. NIES-68]|nr:hypothetical protein CLOM_g23095 [Closterium sp. NIES-68]